MQAQVASWPGMTTDVRPHQGCIGQPEPELHQRGMQQPCTIELGKIQQRVKRWIACILNVPWRVAEVEMNIL